MAETRPHDQEEFKQYERWMIMTYGSAATMAPAGMKWYEGATYKEWASLGYPLVWFSYDEIIAATRLTPAQRFAEISDWFPESLQDWLMGEEGAGFLQTLPIIGGVVIQLPNGEYWDVENMRFMNPDEAKVIIDTATGVEPPNKTETYYAYDGTVFGYQLDDGSYVASDGESPATLAQIQSWIKVYEEAQGLEPVPEGATYDPRTGIYTMPDGSQMVRDDKGNLYPVTPGAEIPEGSTYNPQDQTWTLPDGTVVTLDPVSGKIIPVTPQDVIPPFPTEPAPQGYHWEFNPTTGRYEPVVGVLPPQIPPDAVVVVPDQLYQLPDGSYVDGNGYPVAPESAEVIIDDFLPDGYAPMPATPPTTGYHWEWDGEKWIESPGYLQPPPTVPGQEPITPYQEEQLRLERERLAEQQRQFNIQQEEARKQHLADLMANPISWLEYSLEAGKTPAIQPWMQPLMYGQYAGMQAGQPMPNWPGQPTQPTGISVGGAPPGYGQPSLPSVGAPTSQPMTMSQEEMDALMAQAVQDPSFIAANEAARAAYAALMADPNNPELGAAYSNAEANFNAITERLVRPKRFGAPGTPVREVSMPQQQQTAQWGEQGLTGMPELLTPSRQYQARIGPTAEQMYYGYQKARTGVPAEETQWRLWSQAPPGGRRIGLSIRR